MYKFTHNSSLSTITHPKQKTPFVQPTGRKEFVVPPEFADAQQRPPQCRVTMQTAQPLPAGDALASQSNNHQASEVLTWPALLSRTGRQLAVKAPSPILVSVCVFHDLITSQYNTRVPCCQSSFLAWGRGLFHVEGKLSNLREEARPCSYAQSLAGLFPEGVRPEPEIHPLGRFCCARRVALDFVGL
jgi:hypothetical protein